MLNEDQTDSSGDRGLIQSGVEKGIWVQGVIGQKSMTENVGIDRLHVIGVNSVLALEKCKRARGRLERQSATDGDCMVLTGKRPRCLAEGEKVALKVV